MKDLHKLKDGTKLVWDTMQHLYGEEPKRIYHACIKSETHKTNPGLGARIRSKNSNHWMGDNIEHLRLPTEEELKTLNWDF
jgi:hypothetical protein